MNPEIDTVFSYPNASHSQNLLFVDGGVLEILGGNETGNILKDRHQRIILLWRIKTALLIN